MKRLLIDTEGCAHDIDSAEFNLEELRRKGLMPEDYELCGTCGFDHEYAITAWKEIKMAHYGEDCD